VSMTQRYAHLADESVRNGMKVASNNVIRCWR
jgi:hypothetical protein